MDLLWSKDKLHKIFSKDSLAMTITHASGDGCVSIRCCRVCGGDTSLRSFNRAYIYDGTEERYDRIFYDCFGIKVYPEDCLICEHCVLQLRNIERFRLLVHNAFVKKRSEYSLKHSRLGIGEGYTRSRSKPKVDDVTVNSLKSVVKLRKRKSKTIAVPKTREIRRDRCSSVLSTTSAVKRIILTCMMCKQRYPMLVPFEGWKEFICSRCKKKQEARNSERCKLKMASSLIRERLALHSKADLCGQNRLSCPSKRSTQLLKKEDKSRTRDQKYQCKLCPKKYVVPQQLARHMSNAHNNIEIFECAVCSKSFNNKDALEKHMRIHTGQPVYQCDVCLKTFKGKRSFQTHYLTHGR